MDVLDPARSALVVVHMVKGVAGKVDTPFNRLFRRRAEETGIIKAQLRLLDGFRRAKAKVVFTAVTYQQIKWASGSASPIVEARLYERLIAFLNRRILCHTRPLTIF
jgi:nicotinamidase-related amidase